MTDPHVYGYRPIRQKPIVRNESPRACDHPGCNTRLVPYNRGVFCYTHTPRKLPRSPRGTVA